MVKSGSGLRQRPDNLGGGVTIGKYWLFRGQERAGGLVGEKVLGIIIHSAQK